ncbi:electron transfer flavoprotein subunit alpha/FixB family protein [Moorella sulfitireducens]|uniref:electron transfer flavoprotein subunit alpha/FixB family protein n=1 Tax=Neomoorella sulfitireducens TaxID=2972948 RepID=UPI0021AC43FB|nr:FAD-binding protein [Moorella sulfitireducens]
MSSEIKVWIIAEKPQGTAELIAGAKNFTDNVTALVIGPQERAEQAVRLGAGKVYWLGEAGPGMMWEDYTDTILSLLQQENPALMLVHATKRGKLLAGRLAANLGTTVLTDVMELTWEVDRFKATRRVYGGSAVRQERALTGTTIATVGSGVFTPLPEEAGRTGTIIEVPFVEPKIRIKLVEKKKRETVSVNLPAAKRIVCVGRGLARQEDLGLVEELARLLEAEMACTRPIAEGLNWMPRERYIGVSGAMVKPDLYLALGVSGQIQHMVGANQSRTIAAVNTDKAAPIFNQADYGIVGDLKKIVPALIARFKAE